MFRPLSLFIGLRYVRARSHKFFVSFITWVSLAGVCVGVAALIVILSVMNGFEGELRDRLLSLGAHARVVSSQSAHMSAQQNAPRLSPSARWKAARTAIAKVPGVAGAAPYIEVQALAVRTPEMLPVLLRGIDPQEEEQVTSVARAVTQGKLADLIPGYDRVIVGAAVASRLGLILGDSITLLIPTVGADGTPAPRLREMIVVGIFEVGLQDHDGILMFAHLNDVRSIAPAASGEALRLRFDDAMRAPIRAQEVQARLPSGLEVIDWTRDHANYFRAIRIEKTMMSLILLLIVAVAAFNIVAMLVMVVTDKRTDIAILRTFGATPRTVMGTFITQGLVIGWLGVALGVGLGVLIARNVDVIVPALERTLRFQIMDADVYYITRIPSDLHWENVALIGVAALVLTALATVYPARRAARTAPAEALRYE